MSSFLGAFNKAKEQTMNIFQNASNHISNRFQGSLDASPPNSPKRIRKCHLNNMSNENPHFNENVSVSTNSKVFNVSVGSNQSSNSIKYNEPMPQNAKLMDNTSELNSFSSVNSPLTCSDNVNNLQSNLSVNSSNTVTYENEDLLNNMIKNESLKFESLQSLMDDISNTLNQVISPVICDSEISKYENSNCNVQPIKSSETFERESLKLNDDPFNFQCNSLFNNESSFNPFSVDVQSIDEKTCNTSINIGSPCSETLKNISNIPSIPVELNKENNVSESTHMPQNSILPDSIAFKKSTAFGKNEFEDFNLRHNFKNEAFEFENSTNSESISPQQSNFDNCLHLKGVDDIGLRNNKASNPLKVNPKYYCIFCRSSDHSSHFCTKFSSSNQFWTVVFYEERCKNCFRQFHQSHKCFDHSFCSFTNCRRTDKHSPVLCRTRYKTSKSYNPPGNYFPLSNVYANSYQVKNNSSSISEYKFSNDVSKCVFSQGTQTENQLYISVMVQTEDCEYNSIGVQTSLANENSSDDISSTLPSMGTSSDCDVNIVKSNDYKSSDPDEISANFYRMIMPKLRNLPKTDYQNPYL